MNKEKVTKKIIEVLWKCENILNLKPEDVDITQQKLMDRINNVGNSHCGSWLGYHSNIYYNKFQAIPAGARFDIEWGFYQSYSNGTIGDWAEFDFDTVKDYIFNEISKNSEKLLINTCKKSDDYINEVKLLFETLLEVLLEANNTTFFKELKGKLSNIKLHISQSDFANALNPRRQYVSQDSTAMSQGFQVPPHIKLQAWLASLLSPIHAAKEILELAKKAMTYMKLNDILERRDIMPGSKVFFGHGQSSLWRELKDFIKDRLNLSWEEFNREPVAGKTTVERIKEMLDVSCFASLIMTGEDEHSDSSIHARENVFL